MSDTAESTGQIERAGQRRRREQEVVWFVELRDKSETIAPSYFVVAATDQEAREAALAQEHRRRHPDMRRAIQVNKIERLGPVLLVDRLLALEPDPPGPVPLHPVRDC